MFKFTLGGEKKYLLDVLGRGKLYEERPRDDGEASQGQKIIPAVHYQRRNCKENVGSKIEEWAQLKKLKIIEY